MIVPKDLKMTKLLFYIKDPQIIADQEINEGDIKEFLRAAHLFQERLDSPWSC